MSQDNSLNSKASLDEKLKSAFKEMDANLDEGELKKEVFKTMDRFKLFGDIFNLHTVKLTEVEASFLDELLRKKNKK